MTADLDEFRIEWEWEPAPTVRAPEHRATWARIEIKVGADQVTLVEDQESSSSRRSIYCPLYPIAEWITYNWWLLQANSRPAVPIELLQGESLGWHGDRSNAASRHCMRSAGDGFWWPNLWVVPEGRATLLRWSADRSYGPDKRFRYLSQGYRFVSAGLVMHVLSGLVESVIGRLRDQGVADVPLIEEWNAIQQADDEEVQFCLAAARLGLDAYADPDVPEDALIQASRELDGILLADFLDAVDPRQVNTALGWISTARDTVAKSLHKRESLTAARAAVRAHDVSKSSLPWQVGRAQARSVREELKLSSSEPFDPGRYVEYLAQPSHDRRLQALGGTGVDDRNLTVVVGRPANERARRFTLSRAIWRFLAEDEPVFLVTASYTDRQKIERAFAAELLAPAAGISELLGSDTLVEEDFDEIADHFRVSAKVIEHQVQNQLLT